MNRNEAIEVLKRHNKWRRHDADEPMPIPDSPTNIGLAIDAVAVSCKWKLNDPDYGVWDTGCGNEHQFYDGGIDDNSYEYCPYCGGEVDSE